MAVVGSVARPHGIRGQLIVNVDTDFPEKRFHPGAELFVMRGQEIERLTMTAVRFHQGRPIVAFDGIDSVELAQPLAGLELRVPRERLLRLPVGSFYRHDLVGCRVETSTGLPVGVVTDVEGTIDVGRLVVTAGREEILIPLASAICTAIDTERKRVVIEPPDGLLELNR
jgi:16S rRNA processing protein RimM